MLTTAEMLLGLSRHLGAYGSSIPKADLGQLEFAGHVLEVACRVRGSGVTPADRVAAMALDAGISKRRLTHEILPTLEALGLIGLERDRSGALAKISERVPPHDELFGMAEALLSIVMPEPIERMALRILEETTKMPIAMEAAIEICANLGEESLAQRAIEDLEALRLCDRQHSADDAVVLYNPNVWAGDRDYTESAIRAMDASVRVALADLLDEVSKTAGMPEEDVQSCEPKWINYAVSQGLLLRSLVKTDTGHERAFLFSPHMGRSAFEEPSVDPSGHVRQLIGSMVFARRYASNRLFAPQAFLRRLVREGEAGDATNIATDYSMLETAGIVRVERGARYFKFVLLQSDVAETALSYLNAEGDSGAAPGGLSDQRRYRHPEQERARRRAELGKEAPPAAAVTENILAALRQEAGKRRYGR